MPRYQMLQRSQTVVRGQHLARVTVGLQDILQKWTPNMLGRQAGLIGEMESRTCFVIDALFTSMPCVQEEIATCSRR